MRFDMNNPCDEEDRDFFYASTTITVGNGSKNSFWEAPSVHGRKPNDVAPLIHEASTRKNWKVRDALKEGFWINKIKMTANFSKTRICQFVELWLLISYFPLEEQAEDEITWKHARNGQYSSATAYSVQFLGKVHSPMDHTVWKASTPPKVKFFAWLAIRSNLDSR